MATKLSPKGGEQKKVPITAPEAKPEKDPIKVEKNVKKDDKTVSKGGKEPLKDVKDVKKTGKDVKKGDPAQNRDHGRDRQNDQHRGRDRARHGHDDKSGHREHEKEVCRNFLNNRCDRGALCKFYHPRSPSRSHLGPDDSSRKRSPVRAPGGDDSGGRVVCRDFLRNMCRRGDECRFYHPQPEPGSKKQRSSWLTFCHDFQNGHCTRSDCRFFHITKEDEELYRSTGEIAPQVVDQAVRKALVLDVALTGTRPTCKEFLKGICNMQNCRFRHLSQREYEDEVFHALQDEFEIVLGPPERRRSPSFRPIYSSLSNYHEPPNYSTPPVDYRDDLLAADDLRTTLLSRTDYEPEAKRPRYFSEERAFSSRDDYGDTQRRWDDRVDYDRDRLDFNSTETERMMQEIYHLRNDNLDMRRNLEQKISDLREELNTIMQENEGFRHENTKLRTAANETNVAHKADLEKLTVANNNLTQDCRKAQEALRRLEVENGEIRKALEAKQKANNVELERKLETSGKELIQVRDSLTKANATLKKTQEEKGKLETELEGLKTKMQELQTEMSRKNADVSRKNAHSNNPPVNHRDEYHREPAGKGRPGVGLSELLHPERRGPEVRDQDMRNMGVRGQERYGSDVRGAESRSQYNQGADNRSQYNQGVDRSQYNQGADSRSQYKQGTENRSQYSQGADSRSLHNQGTENRSQYNQVTENRSQYNQGTENRSQYNQGAENRSQYNQGADNRSQYNQSYGIRGSESDVPDIRGQDTRSDSDRPRPWSATGPVQSAWQTSAPSADSGHPRSQSYLSEFQSLDDRMRTQSTSFLRGPSYPPSSTPTSGLLKTPLDMPEYGSQSRSQGLSRGSESQFSSQSISRFEDRDYSLSGYASDTRNQYGNPSRPLNSSVQWQKGGGNDGEGERGRGMSQPWSRRGKPMSNY